MSDMSNPGLQEEASMLLEKARTFLDPYNPVFNIIGFVVVAILTIYIVAYYAGPLLFGTRPYRPGYYPYGRELHHVSKREIMREKREAATALINKVSNALDKY